MFGKFAKLAIGVDAGALAVGLLLSLNLAGRPKPIFPLPAEPADAIPAYPNDPGGPTQAELRQSLKEGREQEVAPMAKWPGVARREGDVLTLTGGGRDLASFTDAHYCDGFDQCSRWRFQGVWRLGGRDYPWLTFFHGEGWETAYLVTPDGVLIGAQGEPVASPDGRWLVTAFDDDDMGGGMTIFEVGPQGPVLVAGSELACAAGEWTSEGLALTCAVEGEKLLRRVKARLVRGQAGWRVVPIAELDETGKKILAQPTAPLTAIAIPALKDDTHDAATVAYETGKGYRKLAPSRPEAGRTPG